MQTRDLAFEQTSEATALREEIGASTRSEAVEAVCKSHPIKIMLNALERSQR